MDKLAEELRQLANSNWLSEYDQQILIRAALRLDTQPRWKRLLTNVFCSRRRNQSNG